MNRSVSTMTGKTKIKIVFLGNQSVGKSSVIEKYVKDVFDETANPTVGIDFLVKNITQGAKSYRLQLWDTAGQQRFRSLIPNYLKDAKCAIIIIDVTNRASLNNVDMWLKLYNDNRTGEGFTLLVGNKIDLEYREVTQQQAEKKAEQLGLQYFQISAKTGDNIDTLFTKIIDMIQQKTVNINMKTGNPGAIKQQENNKEQDDTQAVKQKKGRRQVGNKTNQKSTAQSKSDQKQNVVLKNQQIKKGQQKKQGGCC